MIAILQIIWGHICIFDEIQNSGRKGRDSYLSTIMVNKSLLAIFLKASEKPVIG